MTFMVTTTKAIAALALFGLALEPARAITPFGFFFFNQAMERLASSAFGTGQALSPNAPPSWAVTIGASELINDKLPLEAGDGFVILLARAPAPAAIEVQALAPQGAAPSAEQLDKAWGPGLIQMFCGSDASLWTRWVALGGSVGIEVRATDGELVRRYGVSRADCQALAKP